MILPEDSDCFVFDLDIVLEEEEQENAEEAALFDVPAQPSTSGRGRGRGRGRRGRGGGQHAQLGDKPARLPCPKCVKTFANETTLKTHKKKHAMTNFLSKIPKGDELRDGMLTVISTSLSKVVANLRVGELAEKVVKISKDIQEVLCSGEKSSALRDLVYGYYSDIVCAENITLSSGLRTTFVVKSNKLLNNEDYVKDMIEVLEPLVSISDRDPYVMNFFVGVFSVYFSEQLLAFILREMLCIAPPTAVLRKKWSTDEISSEDFREIIHYIGGSVLHSLYSLRRRYPNAIRVRTFCDILKTRFEEPKCAADVEVNDCGELEASEVDTSFGMWTLDRDRGGLIYINKDAHNFFLTLADFVLCCEAEDGSLEQDYVYEQVLENRDILNCWDLLVGAELNESKSLDFLQAVCEIVVKCARQGILKRRLNAALKSAYTSVSLRHRVSR